VLNFPSKYGLFLFEVNGRQFAGYGNTYGNYYIVVYKDITDKKALSEEFSKKFVIGWLTLLFLYTLIAYPLWRFSFRVVRKLAQRIKESNPAKLEGLDERVPSELKPIVESYNRLVERLSTYLNTQKFFFYHLSHELKTPLSIIRTSADLALSRQRRPLEMRELLLSIRDAVDRATQTLEKLLLLYRLEAQNVIPKKEKLELRALIMDVLEEFKQLIESKNLNVEIFQDSFEVEGDYELVRSLLSNLIENAIKYSFPNGTIRVHKRDTCLV
jgi:Signal transduction histidine kinase